MEQHIDHVEWRAVEVPHLKQTHVVKFINGAQTTCIKDRVHWSKHGRQGAWERAVKHCSKEIRPQMITI